MGQHFQEARKRIDFGEKSDSLAGHVASHFNGASALMVKDIRKKVSMKIAWKGNIISCMKTFGTNKCKLCMKGRTTVLRLKWEGPDKVMDSNSKLFGACRHNTKFHRSLVTGDIAAESFDDAVSAERVEGV